MSIGNRRPSINEFTPAMTTAEVLTVPETILKASGRPEADGERLRRPLILLRTAEAVLLVPVFSVADGGLVVADDEFDAAHIRCPVIPRSRVELDSAYNRVKVNVKTPPPPLNKQSSIPDLIAANCSAVGARATTDDGLGELLDEARGDSAPPPLFQTAVDEELTNAIITLDEHLGGLQVLNHPKMNTDTLSWWYKRSIGDIEQKKAETDVQSYQSVALIVGVTGIAGSGLAETLSYVDTPGGPWKVYGVGRRACPDWLTTLNVVYVQCDITNTDETRSKLSPLTDITHVFYVSWTGSEDCQLNALMFRNILDSVVPNAPNLKHLALQTGIKYYWGNMAEMDSTNEPHDCPYYENLPRLKQENFYYDLEDLVYESALKKSTLTWSIHRPALIFGFSPCSMMNTVSTLCVYAAICKHEGRPLVYPGTYVSWTCLWDAVDSELLAEHFVWAATCPEAKNQAFNVNNGDVFKWKHLWGVLAKEFDLEAVGYEEGREPVLLEDVMKDKDKVWDEIVRENGLVPTRLRDIAAFWLADVVFRNKETLCSMNKNKEFGFLGFRDTTKSFLNCIKKMRAYKFIP
ncbi:3-oxo-Delta(4-5)-steroid 5-beta-reductase [Striga hermonthica]|uniref:3-oxo-Delta(4-5)-steroid 5-beta-reductase n=1 Tax=Striga hermonthica TaxID=68872 RepID=A0A9N7RPV8_STRHE|nr:3-oxo-Delta(4-5)-steroid 5-beta-reductase [Striga hermonthica]